MTLSLYGQYLTERSNRGILEIDNGFATFEYLPDDIVYIVDLYVVPEKRKNHVASEIADKICEQAIKDGKQHLLGSVDTTAKGASDSMKVLEAYGMKVHKVSGSMVYFIKPLVDTVEVIDGFRG